MSEYLVEGCRSNEFFVGGEHDSIRCRRRTSWMAAALPVGRTDQVPLRCTNLFKASRFHASAELCVVEFTRLNEPAADAEFRTAGLKLPADRSKLTRPRMKNDFAAGCGDRGRRLPWNGPPARWSLVCYSWVEVEPSRFGTVVSRFSERLVK